MFIIYFLECIKGGDIIVMFAMCVVNEKNGIVDMIWNVGLEIIGGELEPLIE